MAEKRAWTLEAARALLPDVRARTQRAVRVVDGLVARRDEAGAQSDEGRRLERRIRQEVSRWVREMEALGVEVKGLWLVDFDNGGGCFCWRWPEEELAYFHGYEDGYEGRVRIQ